MNKYIKFAVLGVLSWALGACSDDLEREPSPVVSPDCIGAYFSESNTYNYELDPAITSVTLTVGRDKTDAAVTVPIKVINNSDNIFVIPESVSFAAGEAETTLDVTFPNAEMGVEYSFELTFAPEYINPYKGESLSRTSIQRIKWENIGMGVYIDGTVSTFFGVSPMAVGVEIEKADLGSSMKYRFYNAYSPAEYYLNRNPDIYDGYPYNGDFLGDRLFVLTSNIDGVSMQVARTGLDLGYGEMIIGSVYGNLSSDIKTYPLGTIANNVITFPVNSLFIQDNDGASPAGKNETKLYLSMDDYIAGFETGE